MSGLTEKAGGTSSEGESIIDQARLAWQESMSRQIERLRESILSESPHNLADRCGAQYSDDQIKLTYWGDSIGITWPDLEAFALPQNTSCSTFDQAMLLYYLRTADGAQMADRWIAFRELPDGSFYHQAFQGYSGDLIAQHFGTQTNQFNIAAQSIDGWHLSAIGPHAYAFQPLPRIRTAAILWPGDEEFPARASVLFDAASSHYLPTDGLALIGAGLARRLVRATE